MSTESCPTHGANFESGCEPCWDAYRAWGNRVTKEEKPK